MNKLAATHLPQCYVNYSQYSQLVISARGKFFLYIEAQYGELLLLNINCKISTLIRSIAP